jgi:hypothetical protein
MWPATRAVFGAEIHMAPGQQWGRFVKLGDGERSLGTVQAKSVLSVEYGPRRNGNTWDYRLHFVDGTQEEFKLAVVDLAFRRKLDELRDDGLSPERAAATVLRSLRQQTVYLRIGLARGWDRYPDRCYLQITGVYGFPR